MTTEVVSDGNQTKPKIYLKNSIERMRKPRSSIEKVFYGTDMCGCHIMIANQEGLQLPGTKRVRACVCMLKSGSELRRVCVCMCVCVCVCRKVVVN